LITQNEFAPRIKSIIGVLFTTYAQYNQCFRNNQKIYIQTPQNLFGEQTSPPGFANNQRVPQKSDLELSLESLVLDQTRHNQEFKIQAENLNDSLVRLSSKVDSFCTHNKMLETQIPQVVQQVASSSQTSGIFPSQPEANLKGQMNDITLRNGRQLEDPVVKTKTTEVEVESEKPRSEKLVVESEEPNTPPPYKPKIHFPQGFDKQFRKFIEIIQDKLPPKLKDPGSFSIQCVIGSETIEKVMCDLGASVSLMPLSLSERLGIWQINLFIVKLMTLKEHFVGGNPRVLLLLFCLFCM